MTPEELIEAMNPIIWTNGSVTLRYWDLKEDPQIDLKAFYEYRRLLENLQDHLESAR